MNLYTVLYYDQYHQKTTLHGCFLSVTKENAIFDFWVSIGDPENLTCSETANLIEVTTYPERENRPYFDVEMSQILANIPYTPEVLTYQEFLDTVIWTHLPDQKHICKLDLILEN